MNYSNYTLHPITTIVEKYMIQIKLCIFPLTDNYSLYEYDQIWVYFLLLEIIQILQYTSIMFKSPFKEKSALMVHIVN